MVQAAQHTFLPLSRLAWACAVLILLITSLSAFIRLSRAGVGCEPWPQCHTLRRDMTPAAIAGLDSPGVVRARLAHRVVASAALFLVIAMLVFCYTRVPALRREGRLALALVLLGVFLAVLGRAAGDSRAVAVVLGNLLGGFAMFALAVSLALSCGARTGTHAPGPRLRRFALAGLAVMAAQVAIGGLLSATGEASRCGASLVCDVHRGGALLAVVTLLSLGVAAWRAGRRAGAAIVVLVLGQSVLGATMSALALPLALSWAHNLVAALLAASLVSLLSPPRACQ